VLNSEHVGWTFYLQTYVLCVSLPIGSVGMGCALGTVITFRDVHYVAAFCFGAFWMWKFCKDKYHAGRGFEGPEEEQR